MRPESGNTHHFHGNNRHCASSGWPAVVLGRLIGAPRHTPDTSQSTVHTSTFNLDVNGRVNTVVINDDRPRTVTFVTDANGQVLTRTELDNNPNLADPKDQYFYFSGRRIGEVTNNGSYVSTYQGAMYDRASSGPASPTPFNNGNYAVHNIDFDLAYEALTPHSIRSGGTSWTIRDGDTLQGIAAAVWGDASLWYMIAEANGLTSASNNIHTLPYSPLAFPRQFTLICRF